MKKILFLFFLSISFLNLSHAVDIQIKYKINNEIITNQDIINEINYLIAMNKNLNSLSKEQVKSFAINSIIQEKIKFLELKKYFDFDMLSDEANSLIKKNIYSRTNTKNQKDLDNYLKDFGLEPGEIDLKFKIELLWNKLIYDKYKKNININKSKLREKINNDIKNKSNIYEYNIREILFELDTNEDLNLKFEKIKQTIKSNSFGVAATIYSISNSSENGGQIGWIRETQLSKEILNKIKNLNINDYTDPFLVGNGYLILELSEQREVELKINIDKELEVLIQSETDRQLNQFSTIYFNKIKKSILINET